MSLKEPNYPTHIFFGEAGTLYDEMLSRIVPSLQPVTQKIEDETDFLSLMGRDVGAGNKLYAEELLFRIYIVAVVSLRRNQQWYDAATYAPNDFGFFAALRGLLESITDSYHSMQNAPLTLASSFTEFSSALKGQTRHGVIICEELENLALHFTHARGVRKGEAKDMEKNHQAMGPTKYIRLLDKDKKLGFEAFYKDLCDLTHPASSSVSDFLSWNEKTKECTTHDTTRRALDSVVTNHFKAIRSLLEYGFNPALALLKIINLFPIKKLHTPTLDSISLDKIPLWQNCEKAMRTNQQTIGRQHLN